MIPNITASQIYSILGNNSSKVPLAIKDIANSCGLTAASYMAGDKFEGKDRFIDEFGTQAIWLWGIPAYQTIMNYAMFKPMGFDYEIDARILKNPEIANLAIDFAPNNAIKNSIKKALSHQSKFKALTLAKFAASTLLTIGSYFGLTKFRHKYTEDQIKKEYLSKHSQKQNSQQADFYPEVPFSSAFAQVHKPKSAKVPFTGGLQDFIFDPVKNLMIVDASITGERLTHSRNPQDFFGYVIKEGSFWAFMYLAGPMISKALEKHADKKGKSIDLDARVIFGEQLKKSFADGSLKTHITEFLNADKSDVDIYKFAVSPNNKNLVVDMAKKSDIITLVKNSDLVDTRKYIDLDDLRGVGKKLEKLLNQYESSGESLDEFFKQVRKMKKGAVLKNIGSCIGALGILAPAIMLISRKLDSNSGYQVKKDVEKELQKNNK